MTIDPNGNVTTSDFAMREEIAEFDTVLPERVGGVNLNSTLLNLQIKRDGQGVPLPVESQPWNGIEINGFSPVIINITPAPMIPFLMGVIQEDNFPADSLSYLN